MHVCVKFTYSKKKKSLILGDIFFNNLFDTLVKASNAKIWDYHIDNVKVGLEKSLITQL